MAGSSNMRARVHFSMAQHTGGAMGSSTVITRLAASLA
jgi:hypothetical protein